jgi:hypothetical protein
MMRKGLVLLLIKLATVDLAFFRLEALQLLDLSLKL